MYMFNSHPTTAEPGERVCVVQGCDPQRQSRYKGQHDGRVEFRIARVADHSDPAATGWRWTAWSNTKQTAYFVDDFVIRASIDLTSEGQSPHLYGLEAIFETTNSEVNLRLAKAAARTLGAVEKVFDGHRRSGNYVDIVPLVRQAMKAVFKIERFIGYADDTARGGLDRVDLFTNLPHNRALLNHVGRIYAKLTGNPVIHIGPEV